LICKGAGVKRIIIIIIKYNSFILYVLLIYKYYKLQLLNYIYILITLTKNKKTLTSDDIFNDRSFKDNQRLLKLKQTGTTREYISDFRAIALRLN